MSHPFGEAPNTALPGPARGARQDAAAREAAQSKRARQRYAVASMVMAFAPNASRRAQQALIEQAIKAGALEGPVPSVSSIRRLLAKRRAGDNTIARFRDLPRTGRIPKPLDSRLRDIIESAVRTKRPATIRRVHQLVVATARAKGLRAPSYSTVYALYKAEGALLSVAANHGKEAAEMDAQPHSTVPAPHSNDVWTLDEFVLPVWTRRYDRTSKTWLSFKPTVVLIVDNCSRVILSAWVCDPDRRWARTEPTPRWGADNADVLAALYGAAFPEVASSACRPYAGYLPTTLRWDNAKTHDSLEAGLKSIRVSVPDLPGDRPINRGIVERPVGTLKGMCDCILGFAGEYSPTDITPDDVGDAQQEAAGGETRVRTRTPIAPEFLYDIEEVRAHFDEVVRKYNEEHEHTALEGQHPGDVYRMRLRRPVERRPGRDLLEMTDPTVVRVTRDGVVHWDGAHRYRFAYTDGAISLRLGTAVSYRPDPALRGLFAQVRGTSLFLKPLSVWAAEQDPAVIAREQRSAAQLAQHDAQNARRLEDAQAIGLAVLDREESARAAKAARAGDTEDGDEDAGREESQDTSSSGEAIPDTVSLQLDEDLAGFGPLFARPTSNSGSSQTSSASSSSPTLSAHDTTPNVDGGERHE